MFKFPTKEEFLNKHDLLVDYKRILEHMNEAAKENLNQVIIHFNGKTAGIRADRANRFLKEKGYSVRLENSTELEPDKNKSVRVVKITIGW